MTSKTYRKSHFKKGHPKLPGAGRKKGTPNKFTTLKQAFLNSFVNIGGEDALTMWGKPYKNRKDFYKMVATMLPRKAEVSGPDGKPLEFTDVKAKLIDRISGIASSGDESKDNQ